MSHRTQTGGGRGDTPSCRLRCKTAQTENGAGTNVPFHSRTIGGSNPWVGAVCWATPLVMAVRSPRLRKGGLVCRERRAQRRRTAATVMSSAAGKGGGGMRLARGGRKGGGATHPVGKRGKSGGSHGEEAARIDRWLGHGGGGSMNISLSRGSSDVHPPARPAGFRWLSLGAPLWDPPPHRNRTCGGSLSAGPPHGALRTGSLGSQCI